MYVNIFRCSIFITLSLSLGSCRNISCYINPLYGSHKQDSNPNVAHIISEGDADVMHYIFSTYRIPSIIIARTTKETEVLVNTSKIISFENDAILFKNSQPLEAVGLVFNEVWKFRYPNDSVKVDYHISEESFSFSSFVWTSVNDSFICSSGFASAVLNANSDDSLFSENGTFQLQISVSAKQEKASSFPHLVFTGNSSMFKLVLDKLHSNSSKVRYGIGLSVFATLDEKCSNDIWKTSVTRSINDQFSPGVFTDVELLAPCSDEASNNSSFVAWRPVAYSGKVPIVANSSDVLLSRLVQNQIKANNSIVELYFSGKANGSDFNVTFGTQGDGFYTKTEYSEWSLMIGTGQMVEIPLSTSVIIFAVFGLGLLALFLISGGGYVLYRHIFKRDDDLLLN